MDPAHAWSADDAAHLSAIYETLVDLDNGFQPVPRLAESWESNADGTQWTFHLREDVKFHDGSDFDAGDVVHTYRRLLDPEIGSAGLSLLAAFLEPDGIQTIDKHTVRFTATQPTAELPDSDLDEVQRDSLRRGEVRGPQGPRQRHRPPAVEDTVHDWRSGARAEP